MIDELEKAKAYAAGARSKLVEKEQELAELEALVKAKKEAIRQTRIWVENLESYAHDVEGGLIDCEHEYTVKPSERGIGFDQVCDHCGWVGNLKPVY